MSKLIPIPLGPNSDPGRSKYVGEPSIVNGFIETSKQGKVPFAIYGDPGLVSFTTFSEGSIRGGIVLGSAAYVVAGETLYKVLSNGSKTSIGDIVGTQSVICARNAAATPEVIIVSDTIVYHLTADVVQVYPDGDLPSGVVSVTSLGHRIIFLLADGRFFWSDVNNADSVDALNFKTAEARPDAGVRNITLSNEMWILGAETTEVFGLSTSTSDPFPRIQGGLIAHGTKSKHAVCEADNTIVWPSHKPMVVRAEGFNAKRISNFAVDRDLQRTYDAQRADEIEAFVFSEGGHEFYQISGPDWTWIYDFSTQLWHEGESLGEGRSRRRHYFNAFDKHIVGDYESATLYQMTLDAFDENDVEFPLTITTPILDELGYNIIWDTVMLDCELGVGSGADTAADEYNPAITLKWSDDGMHTWSPERTRQLGQSANWKGQISFNELGMSKVQGRAYRIGISGKVKKAVLQARARVRLMPQQGIAA